MSSISLRSRLARRAGALLKGAAAFCLLGSLAACEHHGRPFVPITPHGPDSTLVEGLEEGRWVRRKSPYYVMSPITVLAGRQLVIEPGVAVVFTRETYSIQVKGKLLAVGKPDSAITFRPTLRVSSPVFAWDGISFQGAGSRDSRIEFAFLDYTKTAVRAVDTSIFLRSVTLRNAEVDGLSATRSSLNLLDCTVAGNGRHGIYLDRCENPPHLVRFEHLNIGHNIASGIWSTNSSYLLLRSDVKNNGLEGTPELNAISSGLHFDGLSGLVVPALHFCNVELNQPCDVRNLMTGELTVQADSNWWGVTTTQELAIRSAGDHNRCDFNLTRICDALDSLHAEAPTVRVCHWLNDFAPNFPNSSQSPDWGRLTPRAR